MQPKPDTGHSWTDWLTDKALRSVILCLLLLPYRARVWTMGWVTRRILAPLAGYNRRSLANLCLIYPNMSETQRHQITAGVADNMGRTFIENYSTRAFLPRMEKTAISGPGVDAIQTARETGQPVILASGHFGNYEAARAALVGRGYDVGGLYRPARNKYFNKHYAQTMLAFGGPVFEQGLKGTSGFVRHLKSGGLLVLLFDQHVIDGTALPFLGKPAATATSAAQLALRYNALLVPFYATRLPDGINFDIQFDAPVPHSDPDSMTRALNASLEARIQTHPEQWLWIHRRWKISGHKP
ncbi:MAG: lysophospholipid acyltransferase family protein [Paracoccaceae bacterium]